MGWNGGEETVNDIYWYFVASTHVRPSFPLYGRQYTILWFLFSNKVNHSRYHYAYIAPLALNALTIMMK